jgi:hypothetical protein
MELELWSDLSQAISALQRQIRRCRGDQYSTASIVRVYLWAVLHDRPMIWACDARNWTQQTRPRQLPDQSTLSRRTRRADFQEFLAKMGRRLNGAAKTQYLKIIDGKPLELPNHTSDRDARWGRGVSRHSIGYKIHAIISENPLPDALAITPLNVCEKRMAHRLIRRVEGSGYLLADGNYDASWLFDVCRDQGRQLVCPRAKPGTGIGHRYQSPHRLRAIDMLEPPATINDFGRQLYRRRSDIERQFSQMVSFGGGLTCLPPWVRRIWRVRNWVWAKLLINAARIRRRTKRAA